MRVKFGFLLSTASLIGGGGYNPEKDFRESPIVMLKKVGDKVTKDDLIVEVSTDKVTAEVPLDGLCGVDSGTIVKLNFSESDTWQYRGIEEVSGRKMFMPELGEIETEDTVAQEAPIDAPLRARAAPAARKLAREAGIDIETIEGTGPNGRVMRTDVERAIAGVEKPEQPPELDDRVLLNAPQIRKTIARFMTLSHTKIPRAGDALAVNVTILREFLAKYKKFLFAYDGLELRWEHILMYLAAKLLPREEFAILNAYWDEEANDGYKMKQVNIGIAVQTEAGLMVPVIHNAQTISFLALVKATEDKIKRALARQITISELRDLTFTINNVGAAGGEFPDPLIPYTAGNDGKERPTAMILALGRAKQDPADHLWYAQLVFKFDHRLFDGVPAIRFALAIRNYIESKKDADEFLELFDLDFTIK